MKSLFTSWPRRQRRARTYVFALAALVIALLGVGCTKSGDDTSGGPGVQPEPPIGATEFVSAATSPGYNQRSFPPDAAAGGETDGGGASERTVEEGDIFRVMADGLVLNLNSYRGLQVLDVSDVNDPIVAGGLRLAGYPVEGYVTGSYAVVLLNDWYGYAWTASGLLEQGTGGAVLLVDISDPAAPMLVDHVAIPGWIRTSRMVSGGGQVAVYVAAERWATSGAGEVSPEVVVDAVGVASSSAATVVASLSVDTSTGALIERDTIELGGWISDIHATAEALLVARTDFTQESGSLVSVIDISDPDGTMVQGGEVPVKGIVESQFNMDIRGNILRVVSDGRWTPSEANHLETFDVSDIQTPVPVDHEAFGEQEQLYATIFLEDRAFFVTYFVTDPFHAFSIDPSGDATEVTAFVVSGWNDFFRPVMEDTRLIGIGVNDGGGQRRVAVSLYDITDLSNPEPLMARAEVDLEYSWSEASWEHRAFSVLEDAVAVEGPRGAQETGLVLLPFNGWDDNSYTSGVQLFTFSASSLTARGTMSHGSPVRRTFTAMPEVAANLSDIELSLYGITDPDNPTAFGTLPLAPSYTHLFAFGDWLVRIENPLDYSWYSYDTAVEAPMMHAQVVPGDADPDSALAVYEVDFPAGASLLQVGDLLLVMTTRYDEERAVADKDNAWVTSIAVWDFADPTAPALATTVETTELSPYGYYGGYGYPVDVAMGAPEAAADACYDCGWPWWWSGGWQNALVAEGAVAFVRSTTESEPAGMRKDCWTWPTSSGEGGSSGGGTVEPDAGTGGGTEDGGSAEPPDIGGARKADEATEPSAWYAGGIYCTSINGGDETCSGALVECSTETGECVEVDPTAVDTSTECNEYEFERVWQRYIFHILDLTTPAEAAFAEPVEMPEAAAAAGAVVDGQHVWYSSSVPYTLEGDDRPYVKYYATRISLADPAAPVVGPAINVPGTLLLADGDELYTQDYVYGDDVVESAVSRVVVQGNLAELEGRHRFDGRAVSKILLDGGGHVLVAHGPVWTYRYGAYYAEPYYYGYDGVDMNGNGHRLTVLDQGTFDELGSLDLQMWATLEAAVPDKALMQVPGGFLVVDVSGSGSPTPQAWFAAIGWPQSLLVRNGKAIFASGRYGIYTLDLNDTNLLPELNVLQ